MTDRGDTRERLVEAARNLFWKQGYGATGIAEILKAAGANSGSLYHFFPTKEDLLVAVLEKYLTLLRPMVIDPVWERVTDPIERVFGVLDGYRRMLHETGFLFGCPIGNLSLEVGSQLPNAAELISRNFTGWQAAVRESIEAAADRLPPEVTPDQLAWFTLTVMEGGVMLARSYRSLDHFDAAVGQLRDYYERVLADGREWDPLKNSAKKKTASRRRASKPRR